MRVIIIVTLWIVFCFFSYAFTLAILIVSDPFDVHSYIIISSVAAPLIASLATFLINRGRNRRTTKKEAARQAYIERLSKKYEQRPLRNNKQKMLKQQTRKEQEFLEQIEHLRAQAANPATHEPLQTDQEIWEQIERLQIKAVNPIATDGEPTQTKQEFFEQQKPIQVQAANQISLAQEIERTQLEKQSYIDRLKQAIEEEKIKREAEASAYFNRIRTTYDLYALDPIQFERFIQNLFERLGYSTQTTPASGDEGIDLRIWKGSRTGIVQCKHWLGTVGQPVVRDLYGTMIHCRADEAFLVTSGSISLPARKWVEGKPVHLIDGIELSKIINDLGDALSVPNKVHTDLKEAWQIAQKGQIGRAQTMVHNILKQNPDNADAWFVLGELYKDPTRKIQAYEHALQVDPSHSYAKRALEKVKSP